MKPGLEVIIGRRKSAAEGPSADDGEGMNVEDEARRSALRGFFAAARSGDIDAGMKAWAAMGECGPPESQGGDEDEVEPDAADASDKPASSEKPARRGMYRD